MINVLRWDLGLCSTEIRKLKDGTLSCHYGTSDGRRVTDIPNANDESLRSIAARSGSMLLLTPEGVDALAEEMQRARRQHFDHDPRHHGVYVGHEKQFLHREAQLVITGDIVMAQFNTGERWETHSRLHFPITDWAITEPLEMETLTHAGTSDIQSSGREADSN